MLRRQGSNGDGEEGHRGSGRGHAVVAFIPLQCVGIESNRTPCFKPSPRPAAPADGQVGIHLRALDDRITVAGQGGVC